MNQENIFVVITTSNITGSKFWPYSRENCPKPFLDLLGTGKSLLQNTYERALGLCPQENILVTTRTEFAHLVTAQLPMLDASQLLLEPFRRNSAPPVAYASYKIREKNPHAIVIVIPADHAVFGELAFIRDIQSAVDFVAEGEKLLALCIKPHKPETRYGYIQYIEDGKEEFIKKVKTFTEKPQPELAQLFLESGDFVWNTGMYVWHVNAIINAFERYLPDIAEVFEQSRPHFYNDQENNFVFEAYSHCNSTSISHGILEKASNVFVLIGKFGWSSLYSWNALHEMQEKDSSQNVVEANTMLYNTNNCYIKAQGNKLVVIQNLEGYLVADCDNVLLICPKENEDQFKVFTTDAKAKKGEKYL